MRLATLAAISVFVGSLALGVLAGSLWTFAGAEWARTVGMALVPALFAGALAYAAALRIAKLGSQAGASGQMGMYELETRIAQGGMGEVWRARHQMLSRPAAVKLIRAPTDGSQVLDDVALRRFEREAQVTASLKSSHTARLYDFGVTESGTFYYVMELLDGVDLEKLVREKGPVEPMRVVRIMAQIADSLAEAHEHGLVHRDIKPANINLSRRGLEEDFVTVLDFGLVKGESLVGDANLSLTAANRITGTPAYIAPELVAGEGRIDGRADLYSLGCVAYFLLTGKLVFEAQAAMQMAIAHVSEIPLPPSQRTRQPIPKALEAIVMKCLEKSPDDRPQSAALLVGMLDAIGPFGEAPTARPASFPVPSQRLVN
jgi:eukaryotic-like serine/threonine-protein kinase